MEKKSIPKSFECLITGEIMKDPVMDPEGNTYERSAIEDWLGRNPTSPITRASLTKDQLIPNRAVKDAIEEHLKGPQPMKIDSDDISEINTQELDKTTKIELSAMKLNDKKNIVSIKILPPNLNTSLIGSGSEPEPEPESGGSGLISSLMSIVSPAKLVAQKQLPKPAIDNVCVIDISYSMSEKATTKDASGSIEQSNLCILDIVKHAVKTQISIAGPTDRIAIVVYSSEAKVVLTLTHMDAIGKALAHSELDKLKPTSQTNIWDGLHNGLEILRNDQTPNRLSNILLFTDGQANISPPRGELAMLQKYFEQHNKRYTINTYGFGNATQEQLLIDIAKEANGSFKYISDPGMVGTVFVNQIANSYSTISNNVILSLETLHSPGISNIPGHYNTNKTEWGIQLNIGPITYGQTREIVFETNIPVMDEGTPLFQATIQYLTRYNDEVRCENILCYTANFQEIKPDILFDHIRHYTIDELLKALKSHNNAEQQQIVDILILYIQSFGIMNENINAILQDLTGQIKLAFLPQYINDWGKYYIPSLIFAYQQQQCHNFKDPGVQMYGGILFKQLCDEAEAIFCKLPVPKPCMGESQTMRGGFRGGGKAAPTKASTPPSMDQYYNRGGGCFTGDTKIYINKNVCINAGDIKSGDNVLTINNQVTKIVCVVKYFCRNTDIIRIQNLGITPWHPIKKILSNKWEFPISITKTRKEYITEVYNFVLATGHILIVDDYECVTYGHNLESEIVKHEYFGDKIIDDLKKTNGWESGYINFDEDCFVRNNENEVVGLDLSKEIEL